MALQLGEVVEERRRDAARLRLDRLDRRRARLRTRSTIASASAPSCGRRRASGVGRLAAEPRPAVAPPSAGLRPARTSRRPPGTPRARSARIASSRSTSIASVGVWTRPTESVSPWARVHARERFIPTSQSARLRPRAASASGSKSLRGRSRAKPSRIASGRQRRDPEPLDRLARSRPPRRCSGRSARPRARRRSRRRPRVDVAGRARTFFTARRTAPAVRSATTSGHSDGSRGRSLGRPALPLRPDLAAARPGATRWPMAQVTT